MQCTSPRTVGFLSDGKTISWSPKKFSKEFATFQLPCGKCISCRLLYAQQWAVRCVHEAKMHEQNSFITLTYKDSELKSDKLQIIDFQLFAKKLRKEINKGVMDVETKEKLKIGIFYTGEYGDQTKRPHWHAIIFNWRPSDLKYFRSNERGDKIYKSEILDKIWAKGHTEIGDVTFESAGYCARYAAKKLAHGADQDHNFQPISKKSNKQAIGKSFLEKHWKNIFDRGEINLSKNGEIIKCSIPRYYEKWLQKNHPEYWMTYVTQKKLSKNLDAQSKNQDLQKIYIDNLKERAKNHQSTHDVKSPNQLKNIILKEKFKILQNNLKLK